ncbi:hypothetical protein DFH06DRAFT_951514, partial [Mycena polygramma]
LEHGDSLGHDPAPDVLPVIQWVFSDLTNTTCMSLPPARITQGVIAKQRSDAGGGSCFLAAQNFIESRADPSTPRWIPERSAEFRNKALRELVLYH